MNWTEPGRNVVINSQHTKTTFNAVLEELLEVRFPSHYYIQVNSSKQYISVQREIKDIIYTYHGCPPLP